MLLENYTMYENYILEENFSIKEGLYIIFAAFAGLLGTLFSVLIFSIIIFLVTNNIVLRPNSSVSPNFNDFPEINPKTNFFDRIKDIFSDYKREIFIFTFVTTAGVGIYYYFKYNQSQINFKQLQEQYETRFTLVYEELHQVQTELHRSLNQPSIKRKHYKYAFLKSFYSQNHYDPHKIMIKFFENKKLKEINFDLVFASIRKDCLHLPFIVPEDYITKRLKAHDIFLNLTKNCFFKECPEGNRQLFLTSIKNLSEFVKQNENYLHLSQLTPEDEKFLRYRTAESKDKVFQDNFGKFLNYIFRGEKQYFNNFLSLYMLTFYDFYPDLNVVAVDSLLEYEKQSFLDPLNEIRYIFSVDKKFSLMQSLDVVRNLGNSDMKQRFFKDFVLDFFLNDVLLLNDSNDLIQIRGDIKKFADEIRNTPLVTFKDRLFVRNLILSLRESFYNKMSKESKFDVKIFTDQELEIFLNELYKD